MPGWLSVYIRMYRVVVVYVCFWCFDQINECVYDSYPNQFLCVCCLSATRYRRALMEMCAWDSYMHKCTSIMLIFPLLMLHYVSWYVCFVCIQGYSSFAGKMSNECVCIKRFNWYMRAISRFETKYNNPNHHLLGQQSIKSLSWAEHRACSFSVSW